MIAPLRRELVSGMMRLLLIDFELLQRNWSHKLLDWCRWTHRATLMLVHSTLVFVQAIGTGFIELHLVICSSLTLVLVRLPPCIALEERNLLPALQVLRAAQVSEAISWCFLCKGSLLACCLELVRGSVPSG